MLPLLSKGSLPLSRGIYTSLIKSASAGAAGGHGSEAAVKQWRMLTYFVALPAVVFMSIRVYLYETNHPHERPKFIPYEHLRIRTKRFPWGDGNKTLFHNKHNNALPDGYEDDD